MEFLSCMVGIYIFHAAIIITKVIIRYLTSSDNLVVHYNHNYYNKYYKYI